MSRSYKKHAVVKDGRARTGKKDDKRLANKAVRNAEHVDDGGGFRKIYNTWNITDYKIERTWEEEREFLLKWQERQFRLYGKTDPIDWKHEYRRWRSIYVNK